MKLKNVKVGTDVELKNDVDILKKGQRGVILEDEDDYPYVYWYGFNRGNDAETEVVERLNLPTSNRNVWAVTRDDLKIVK